MNKNKENRDISRKKHSIS